jgi:hypothetical protein
MTSALTAKLHTPPQDLPAPTRFAADSEAAAGWLETLPKTNLGQSTRALYLAITELNRVLLTPAARLQLLETLRPAIHSATAGLRRHYLNQPILLPEQPRKVARLAHVLHEQLATGYVLVAVQAVEEADGDSARLQPTLATAVHRGIVEHSQNLLRDCQLYRDPHPGCWHAIHQLALLARECAIESLPIADTECGDSSVIAAYLRALLLGSAKASQLRQEDLANVFRRLADWAGLARLSAPQQALLVVNPSGDDGPVYREFAAVDDGWLGLQTEALTQYLIRQCEQTEADDGNRALGGDLLAHLSHTWGSARKRAFLRREVNERIDVAVGLTAAHHFVAGTDFRLLLSADGHSKLAQQDDNPFLRAPTANAAQRPQRDVWDKPYQPRAGLALVPLETIDYHIREQHSKDASEREREKFHLHSAAGVDISAGGLRIQWPADDPTQVRAGEIVGIREHHHKNWSLGVIRWLRLLESGPQLGIELLSPTVTAYGARVLHKDGPRGDYLRVLVLPQIKQTGQAATLIAPKLPFRAGQKVSLMYRDQETRIHLTRRIAATATFSQFEFNQLHGFGADDAVAAEAAADTDGSFDISWNDL